MKRKRLVCRLRLKPKQHVHVVVEEEEVLEDPVVQVQVVASNGAGLQVVDQVVVAEAAGREEGKLSFEFGVSSLVCYWVRGRAKYLPLHTNT